MSKLSTQQRLEQLNMLKSNLGRLDAMTELQATQLVKVIFGNKYDLTNKRDIANLLDAIDEEIDTVLKPAALSTVEGAIESATLLGTGHIVASTLSKVADATKYNDLGTRLANNYVNRVAEDGMRLSDRIWSSKDKKSIYQEIYNSIKKGDSNFTLAQNIEKQVAEGTPAYNIKRVAHNEMVYAYNNARYDIAKAESEEYGLETWAKITVSKSHVIEDECDDLAGEYPLDEAPKPPFHVGCNCLFETFVKRK